MHDIFMIALTLAHKTSPNLRKSSQMHFIRAILLFLCGFQRIPTRNIFLVLQFVDLSFYRLNHLSSTACY